MSTWLVLLIVLAAITLLAGLIWCWNDYRRSCQQINIAIWPEQRRRVLSREMHERGVKAKKTGAIPSPLCILCGEYAVNLRGEDDAFMFVCEYCWVAFCSGCGEDYYGPGGWGWVECPLCGNPAVNMTPSGVVTHVHERG